MKKIRNLSPEAIKRARSLRAQSSLSERKLWQALREKQIGFRFRRQYPIGVYFLDFYCPETQINIELDGDAHAFRTEEDAARDEWLAAEGIRTVRVTTAELYEDIEAVLERIRAVCTESKK